MKKIFISLMVVLCTIQLYSQQDSLYRQNNSDEFRTIFGNLRDYGYYSTFSMKYGEFNKLGTFDFGFSFGLIKDHKVGFGLAMNGFIQNSFYDNTAQEDRNIQGGSIGIFVEPIILPKLPIHISVPVYAGFGGLELVKYYDNYNNSYYNNNYDQNIESETFFVVEPGIEIEMNVLKKLRVGFHVSYRYTSNLIMSNVPGVNFNGILGGLTFKFGKF